jgi:hypothetical protein
MKSSLEQHDEILWAIFFAAARVKYANRYTASEEADHELDLLRQKRVTSASVEINQGNPSSSGQQSQAGAIPFDSEPALNQGNDELIEMFSRQNVKHDARYFKNSNVDHVDFSGINNDNLQCDVRLCHDDKRRLEINGYDNENVARFRIEWLAAAPGFTSFIEIDAKGIRRSYRKINVI